MSCYGDVVAPYNTDVFEKMTAWRSSVTQQKKLGLPAPPHMPVVHDAGKALWRGLEPILCASDEGDSRPGLIRWLEEIRTEILESEKHVLDLTRSSILNVIGCSAIIRTFQYGNGRIRRRLI